MPDFHTNLKSIIAAKGISLTELSKEIGKGPNYLSNLINTKGDPSTSTLMGMATALSISTDAITGMEKRISAGPETIDDDAITQNAVNAVDNFLDRSQRRLSKYGLQPTIEEATDWWWDNGGRLSDLNQISEFFDIYAAPNNETNEIKSVRMGLKSASAVTFGIRSTQELNDELRELSELNKPLVRSLANAQRNAVAKQQPEISFEEIDIPTPKGWVRVAYRRLYMPMDFNTKKPLIINLSQRLSINTATVPNVRKSNR